MSRLCGVGRVDATTHASASTPPSHTKHATHTTHVDMYTIAHPPRPVLVAHHPVVGPQRLGGDLAVEARLTHGGEGAGVLAVFRLVSVVVAVVTVVGRFITNAVVSVGRFKFSVISFHASERGSPSRREVRFQTGPSACRPSGTRLQSVGCRFWFLVRQSPHHAPRPRHQPHPNADQHPARTQDHPAHPAGTHPCWPRFSCLGQRG
jgi:hypothetical protein